MTASQAAGIGGSADAGRHPGRVRTFLTTVRAVLTRELRWRMRGKRAFVIALAAVLVLGLIVFGIHQVMLQSALDESRWRLFGGFDDEGLIVDRVGVPLQAVSGEVSARIGQAIFGGVLGVLTALTLLVAPALASGVISSEREKQTMELLVTTPVSTLGMVVGKLIASLVYVVLLIVVSVPLMALVFAFGGIAPEDVLRAYLVILAFAFGSASIGLFLSALLGRTQVATVVSYLVLFGLVVGTLALHTFLLATSWREEANAAPVVQPVDDGRGLDADAGRGDAAMHRVRQVPPEALLLLNPLVTDIDVMCNAIPDTQAFCSYITEIQGVRADVDTARPRDAFWPRSVLAFVIMGLLLTILTTQFISPSRRWHGWRRVRRSPTEPPSDPAPEAAG